MKTLHFLYHELRPAPSRYTYVAGAAEFDAACKLFAHLRAAPSAAFLQPALTFDDGHRSDHDIALPLLAKHGLHAHFFITAGWTKAQAGTRPGYMEASQLRALAAAGHTVGAHGWSHTLLTHCSPAELHHELTDSRAALEDALGAPVTTMSLPGGRAGSRVLEACRAAGYTQVFTSVPRAENLEALPWLVGRLNVRGGATAAWFERVLAADEQVLHTLERNERLKATARTLIGDRLYARLWTLLNRQDNADGLGVLAE